VLLDDDGSVPPVQALGKLNGEPGAGTWSLQVIDDVPGGGNGFLTQWSLEARAGNCQ
jgi:subtilisin-like proprotein convertase family protein